MKTVTQVKPIFTAGSRIEECAEEAIWLYRTINSVIEFSFNGFYILIGAKHRLKMSVEDVLLEYEKYCSMSSSERIMFDLNEKAKSYGYKDYKHFKETGEKILASKKIKK